MRRNENFCTIDEAMEVANFLNANGIGGGVKALMLPGPVIGPSYQSVHDEWGNGQWLLLLNNGAKLVAGLCRRYMGYGQMGVDTLRISARPEPADE